MRISLCILRFAGRIPVLLIFLMRVNTMIQLHTSHRCLTVGSAKRRSVHRPHCGLDDPGFKSRQGQKTFLQNVYTDTKTNPPTLIFEGYRRSFPAVKRPGCHLSTHHTHCVPRLRKSGARYPFPLYVFMVWTKIYFIFRCHTEWRNCVANVLKETERHLHGRADSHFLKLH